MIKNSVKGLLLLTSLSAFALPPSVIPSKTHENVHYLGKGLKIAKIDGEIKINTTGSGWNTDKQKDETDYYKDTIKLEDFLKQVVHSQSSVRIGNYFTNTLESGEKDITGATAGTGFLVGGHFVVTNEHVIAHKDLYQEDGTFKCGLPIIFPVVGDHEAFLCKKVHYCDKESDYCLMELKEFIDPKAEVKRIEKPLDYFHTPVKANFNFTPSDDELVTIIGNHKGWGIQAGSGFGVDEGMENYVQSKLDIKSPVYYYYAPAHQGSSGSPIYDRNMELIGLNSMGYMPRISVKGVLKENEEGEDLFNMAVPLTRVMSQFKKELPKEILGQVFQNKKANIDRIESEKKVMVKLAAALDSGEKMTELLLRNILTTDYSKINHDNFNKVEDFLFNTDYLRTKYKNETFKELFKEIFTYFRVKHSKDAGGIRRLFNYLLEKDGDSRKDWNKAMAKAIDLCFTADNFEPSCVSDKTIAEIIRISNIPNQNVLNTLNTEISEWGSKNVDTLLTSRMFSANIAKYLIERKGHDELLLLCLSGIDSNKLSRDEVECKIDKKEFKRTFPLESERIDLEVIANRFMKEDHVRYASQNIWYGLKNRRALDPATNTLTYKLKKLSKKLAKWSKDRKHSEELAARFQEVILRRAK